MPKEDWLVVGISGATCSGKSTVAQELHLILPESKLLQQDDYFYDEDSEKHTQIPELNHINFEIMSSLNMDKMWEDITSVLDSNTSNQITSVFLDRVQQKAKEIKPHSVYILQDLKKIPYIPNILIIEGFLILNDSRLAELCDLKFYFTLDKNVCWERRKGRVYEPPDVPGYFDSYVWPSYVHNFNQILQKNDPCIHYINGVDTLDCNLNLILKNILNAIGIDIVAE